MPTDLAMSPRRDEIRSGHSSAGTMAEHESRLRGGGVVDVGVRRPVLRLQDDRAHSSMVPGPGLPTARQR